MFNFFDEIKNKCKKLTNNEINFNLINISGQILYVEGHKGLTVISQELMSFKIKNGRVVVEGENLILTELTENTMILQGKIKKTEIF